MDRRHLTFVDIEDIMYLGGNEANDMFFMPFIKALINVIIFSMISHILKI